MPTASPALDLTTARGLYLFGRFDGSEQVTRRTGEAIPGFFRVLVDVSSEGGAGQPPFHRKASYNSHDSDGDPTPIAATIAALKPGCRVALRVKPSTSESSKYVNYEVVDAVVVAPAPASVRSAS